jgi:hypothetical protein
VAAEAAGADSASVATVVRAASSAAAVLIELSPLRIELSLGSDQFWPVDQLLLGPAELSSARRRTEASLRPYAWHPVHRHDVAVCELAIGESSSTVAIATRHREQCRHAGPERREQAKGQPSQRVETAPGRKRS